MTTAPFIVALLASTAALAAAIWTIATGGSDRDALALLAMAVVPFGFLALMMRSTARSQIQLDNWLARFPGPLTLSSPLWRRVLGFALCMGVAVLIFLIAVFGKRGAADDWNFERLVYVGLFGLLIAIGALLILVPRELVLSLEKLESCSIWGTHSHSWLEFSRFRLGGSDIRFVLCEFADRARRPWRLRRGLPILGMLGVSIGTLEELLTRWHARALAAQAQAAASNVRTAAAMSRRD